MDRYVKVIANTKYISEWKSKGLPDESIKPLPTSDNSLTPLIDYYGYKIRAKFNGSILRQPKVSYTHEKAVNIYIVDELAGSSSHSDDQIVYLVRLHYAQTSISMVILAMELVLIKNQVFHFQTVGLVKM